MDIDVIKEIVNSNDSILLKETKIIEHLSEDKNCIPTLLRILERERSTDKELIQDMNQELSRAQIYIDMLKESPEDSKASFNKGFVLDEIAKFYFKYKKFVTHCYNKLN
jgi:hypothetical protein